MSKKGVSAEEKRNRMLQLFYEKGECFQLKELEKIAPKEKGIIANSVKDVVQKLVEDGLVDTGKIGSSVYFWSFPSKAIKSKKRKLKELENQFEQSRKKLKLIQDTVEQSKLDKETHETRNKTLEEISDLQIHVDEAEGELKRLQENSTEKFEVMLKKSQALKDAANRWTDNIFALKAWCKKKFFIEDSTFSKQFGIPEDLDYIE